MGKTRGLHWNSMKNIQVAELGTVKCPLANIYKYYLTCNMMLKLCTIIWLQKAQKMKVNALQLIYMQELLLSSMLFLYNNLGKNYKLLITAVNVSSNNNNNKGDIKA